MMEIQTQVMDVMHSARQSQAGPVKDLLLNAPNAEMECWSQSTRPVTMEILCQVTVALLPAKSILVEMENLMLMKHVMMRTSIMTMDVTRNAY